MKAIILSIQPKYCELIESDKKKIEVRKTAPKLEMPFKCYIYETAQKYKKSTGIFAYGIELKGTAQGRGKVIGEFVCDRIEVYEYSTIDGVDIDDDEILLTCLDREDINIYANGKDLYGLHISNLKVYDKPKELGAFKKAGYMTEDQWLYALYPNTHCHYNAWAKKFEITRPSQSWCYVEELKNKNHKEKLK